MAGIAGQTAAGARSGDETVQKAGDAVADIKRQVDLIVNHMLDLGAKSQQIGGILEIINEMAEQTNILSINASIEAVGAGESGRRFGVVADEIRKLADRVAGSTKEIKSLIDEIRSAVHTTVMATESGSKAVDAGNRRVQRGLRHVPKNRRARRDGDRGVPRNRAEHEAADDRRRTGQHRDRQRGSSRQGIRGELHADLADGLGIDVAVQGIFRGSSSLN